MEQKLSAAPPEEGKESGDGKRRIRDFEAILKGISPNFRWVNGTLDTLYNEVDDYRYVFERLCKIVYDKRYNGRNAIRGDRSGNTKWREDRVGNNDWRIYFCKESRLVGDKFVVYINHKNDQDDDMRLLRKNPPDHYL